MKKFLTGIVIFVAAFSTVTAQVGIGTSSPNASAALDISSSNKGLLLPQMTEVQRTAIQTPATGLLVFQTNGEQGFYYNAGTPVSPNWINLSTYILQQNINTNGKWVSPDGSNKGVFIGAGGVGIGTNNPDRPLSIKADGPGSQLISLKNVTGGTEWHINLPDNGDLNFSESGVADNRLYLKTGGNVGIGTNNPTVKLEVNGDIKGTNNLEIVQDIGYGGDLFMGLTYAQTNAAMPANSFGVMTCPCPAGTRVIGGGGGHRDNNIAAKDIIINYTGPDPDNESTTWRLLIYNTSESSRAVRIYAICAKVR